MTPSTPGQAYRMPVSEVDERLRRVRRVAWVLDRSIPLGGGYRFGLDPLIGLIPGAGDWLGAVLSLYVLYEGARMGLPVPVLVRMGGNIAIESIFGAVPVIGDVFDFVWQANVRNVQLIERHYQPTLQPRSLASIALALGVFVAVLMTIVGFAIYAVVKAVMALFA
jgi:hypothetical protein